MDMTDGERDRLRAFVEGTPLAPVAAEVAEVAAAE
jgi:hypothetical protein